METKLTKVLLLMFTIVIGGKVYSQHANKDTSFIVRESNPEYYHAIFIDTNINSHFYNIIENNTYNPFDSITYYNAVKYSKKSKKYILPDISKDWRLLHIYQGNHYLYAPGEWGYNYWVYINDSTFTEYVFGDGTQPNIIKSAKTIYKNLYEFELCNINRKKRKINVYIIDPQKQIAVFEDASIKGDGRFTLMVAASHIRNFPIIVNYCKNQKCFDEFEFEKPDFKELLKKVK